jgi:hypothetical protein
MNAEWKNVECQRGIVLPARFKVEADQISLSRWTNLRCGPHTVASMADQGLLLVPRRVVCLGIKPSAETNGKDLVAVKVRVNFEKERPAIPLSQPGKTLLSALRR